MHLKKNVEISTLSKGITHGRGVESFSHLIGKSVSFSITHVRGFESGSMRLRFSNS